MRKRVLLSVAAAALTAGLSTQSPMATAAPAGSLHAMARAAPVPLVEPVQHRRYHRGRGLGWGIGAGIAGGLVAGALLAPRYYERPYYGYRSYYYAVPPPADYYDEEPEDAVAYCMRRFRSYDPRSGTYLGYDGYRHPCP